MKNDRKFKAIRVGDIVFSKQGRDSGTYYIVIKKLENHYCLLVNGANRKFINPKKKMGRHLEVTGRTIDNIKVKLEKSDKIFDSEIYSAIKKNKDENNKENQDENENRESES